MFFNLIAKMIIKLKQNHTPEAHPIHVRDQHLLDLSTVHAPIDCLVRPS